MGSDVARRAVAAALGLILAILVFLSAEGSWIKELTAEVERPRQNESIYLEKRGEGTVFVGGEGKLYGADMNALVLGSGLSANTVTDVFIGGGVTEIGYDALCGYTALQTIHLDGGVTIAANGSIRECTALRFVFLPRSFASAGRDFLFDCNSCYVITDGPVDQLPRMKNVNKKRRLGDIDSYDALVQACGEEVKGLEALKLWW